MMRALSLAASVSLLAGLPVPAQGQDEPGARLTSRTVNVPRLSARTLPAAPSVHRLSIGPLAAPAGEDAAPGATIDLGTGDLAIEALVERARRGDAHANYRLGLRYLAGEGVTRDLVEAFARIRLAAEAGYPRAVSLFYFLGANLTADEHGQAYERSRELKAK